MANPPIGNEFHEGSLGVCRVTFDGVDYGKTMDEIDIEFIEDLKDIMFAQDGTQPQDKIPTGQAYQVTVRFAELDAALVAKMYRGCTLSAGGKSVQHGRDIYRSGLANFAKVLLLKRVDSDGAASADNFFRAYFYKAMPIINGPEQFGPDTQRILEVQFYCFFDDTAKTFFYTGYASSLGL